MSVCAGGVGAAVVFLSWSPRQPEALPWFLKGPQRLYDAGAHPAPHTLIQVQGDLAWPLSGQNPLWRHAIPETDKAKQDMLLH